MAITRERKEELVAEYSRLLSQTDGFVIAEFRGLTVANINDLRRRLLPAGGAYSVTKNTLFRIALQENGWPVPSEMLAGPSGVIFGNGNLPAVAKTLQGFVKDSGDRFRIKGGVISTSIFGANDLEAISNLPTLDEVRAQLAGLVVQPASSLAGLLASATSQIVNVLQAYEDARAPKTEEAVVEDAAA